MSDNIVEVMARAIITDRHPDHALAIGDVRGHVRAALAALEAQGYAVVPAKEMGDVLAWLPTNEGCDRAKAALRAAMLKSRPSLPIEDTCCNE